MDITVRPIGFVRNTRTGVEDDFWGGIVSTIELDEAFDEEALQGLETFSHAEVVFYFDRVDEAKIVTVARHPRNNPAWPMAGIFAQRGKNRPNRLGLCVVEIVRREGRHLLVRQLDAVDGTPVLDIKPVMREFLPRGEISQPDWVTELMKEYWDERDPAGS
jgi:tRNA-Thr(GGU) m(6)t(6)A37 methyltransferase TsaA